MSNIELMSSLWKMGLMPFSKHTKSMDYEKYVEGMLGFENSVKLIFELTKFARKSRHIELNKRDFAENESTFGNCLHDLIHNFESLVSTEYDPYGITFPAAYTDVEKRDLD